MRSQLEAKNFDIEKSLFHQVRKKQMQGSACTDAQLICSSVFFCMHVCIKQVSYNTAHNCLTLFFISEHNALTKMKKFDKILETVTIPRKLFEPSHDQTNVLVSDLVRHKPGCTATEDG